MSVTAYLVTRNHEESLGRAIRSVAGFANEVIVADTGSTDRTTGIASELGARVLPIEWADDFSAACNAAVESATGDWVFAVNPDEELDPAGLQALRSAASNPAVFAWQIRVRQRLSPDREGYGTEGWQFRLFRRDPAVRYVGRLHPAFVTPLVSVAAALGFSIGTADAVVIRHAYLSQPTPDKVRWVVRLLEAELRDRPGQLGYTIELGRNLLWLNDPRGHELLAAAAEQVLTSGAEPVAPSAWVGSLIEYLLSALPELSRSPVTRDVARGWAARWFSDTPPVVWAVAAERFAAGDYRAAVENLERLVEMGRTGRYDGAVGFSPAVIGPQASLNLGLCYLHLERWDDARVCFARLRGIPEHYEAAATGLRLADERRRPDR